MSARLPDPALRPALLLALFALVGSALVALTHGITRHDIAENQRRVLVDGFQALVADGTFDNDPLSSPITRVDRRWLGTDEPVQFYRGSRDGEPAVLFATPVAPDGYSGEIRLLVAVHSDGTVAGVRVLAHRETPGLGDRLELSRSDWILGFSGRSLANTLDQHWRVRRDGGVFDQFTGATLTPRAVVTAVHRLLQYLQHNPGLFSDPAEAGP